MEQHYNQDDMTHTYINTTFLAILIFLFYFNSFYNDKNCIKEQLCGKMNDTFVRFGMVDTIPLIELTFFFALYTLYLISIEKLYIFSSWKARITKKNKQCCQWLNQIHIATLECCESPIETRRLCRPMHCPGISAWKPDGRPWVDHRPPVAE